MELIPLIENCSFFENQSGNPSEYPYFLESLHRSIQGGIISEEDPVFAYYLDKASEDFIIGETSSYGPTPTERLTEIIGGHLQNATELSDPDFRLYSFCILGGLFIQLNMIEEAKSVVERYSDQFEEEPFFGKTKVEVLEAAGESDDLSDAIDTAWEYKSDFPRYPVLQMVFAKVVATALENGETYHGENSAIPTNRDDLANSAKEAIRTATTRASYPPEYDVVKGRIEALLEDFSSAKESIRAAIGDLSRTRTRYTELRAEYGQELTRINAEEKQSRLSARTEKINSEVSSIDEKIEETEIHIRDLNKELENTASEFRQSVIEFLGFFSAIIAVIVITGQIALSVTDIDKAAQLMLVSYGGLLFAFGSFSALLSSGDTNRKSRITVAISGLALVFASLFGDDIFGLLQFIWSISKPGTLTWEAIVLVIGAGLGYLVSRFVGRLN